MAKPCRPDFHQYLIIPGVIHIDLTNPKPTLPVSNGGFAAYSHQPFSLFRLTMTAFFNPITPIAK
jgi:hypothetical protein